MTKQETILNKAAASMDLIAWEANGVGLKKFVTNAQYRLFPMKVRRWYKPYPTKPHELPHSV